MNALVFVDGVRVVIDRRIAHPLVVVCDGPEARLPLSPGGVLTEEGDRYVMVGEDRGKRWCVRASKKNLLKLTGFFPSLIFRHQIEVAHVQALVSGMRSENRRS